MAGGLEKVPFGTTDLAVTRLCQGTAFRTLERHEKDTRAREVLQHCLDMGVRFFDSANAYGWGGSERLLGEVLKRATDDVVVCTKIVPRPEDRQDVVVPFSADLLREGVDRSRRRLQRDVIDLFLLHQPDGVTSPEMLCARMQDLVDSGAIRYWGVSNHPSSQVEALVQTATAAGTTPPAGVEDYLTVGGGALTEEGHSRTRCYRQQMLPLLRRDGLGLIAFSPMDRGDLSPERTPEGGSPLERLCADLDAVAADLAVTRAVVCVAWVLSLSGVTSVLGGAESPAHVDAMIAGTLLELPPEARAGLLQASDRYADALEAIDR